ncbi:hypothetical protein ATCC90586_002538 [Pythium insidiosum]|nr:hypothetical protein ATCC90586_002538 [Pythium insidiosum]
MWSEFLLLLESQPDLKRKLQIRRLDNVREFSVAKKELNTQLLLAGDLRSLLRIVDERDDTAMHDPATFDDVCGQLLQSFTFTDHFHEELSRRAFEQLNRGILDEEDHRSVERSKGRAYLVHLDNQLAHRGEEFLLRPGPVLDSCRAAFDARQKRAKHASFRMRHLVVKTLEGMQVDPESLYAFEDLGYIVDVALRRQQIAIEIHNEDSYLAADKRDHRSSSPVNPSNDDDDDDVDIQAVERMRVMPFIDAKTRHLEREGWIVVQLPSQEFQKLKTDDDRRDYLSMLIEIATYSRAAAIEAELEEEEPHKEN